MLFNNIHLSVGYSKIYKWPPLQELKVRNTFEWLEKHWEAFTTMPRNRVERALNAFSYIFHDNLNKNAPTDLFFSLLGIEALFVEGNESVQKQVDIKSQLLIGKRVEFKKVFNELYNFRSKFIHGQLSFFNKYYLNDADPDVENHLFDTYEKSNFAVILLISCIQKHIELDKDEFEYEFILKK